MLHDTTAQELARGQVRGSAFRARRFVAWHLSQLKSRYGELPRNALPGAIPATDSAVAPRRLADSKRTKPSSQARPDPRPDPEYERRLEELARSMLAASAASAPPEVQPERPSQQAQQSPEQPRRPRLDQPSQPSPAPRPARPERPTASRRAPISKPVGIERLEPVLEPLDAPALNANAKPQASGMRKSIVAGAMLAGVVLGISAAWWFLELDKVDRALSTVASSGASGTEGKEASEAAQHSPLVLARPAQDEAALPATPAVVTPAPSAAVAAPTPAPEDLPETKSETKPEAVPKVTAPAAVTKPEVATVDARKAKGREKAPAPRAQPAKRSQPAQLASARNSKKSRQVESQDDIDRLRSQAYSESSRDRERKVLPNSKPSGADAGVAVTPISTAAPEGRLSHKKELAQCEKVDGLFYRERCKWRICKNEWGSNGCPSFPQQGVRF